MNSTFSCRPRFFTVLLALFLMVPALLRAGPSLPISAQIPAGELNALLDLYNSAGGTGWITSTGWTDTSASAWYGVTISGGHVTQLALAQNGLAGVIPNSISSLSGLQVVSLYQNALDGTIPDTMGALSQLASLDLDGNGFTGSIPTTFGNLIALTNLALFDNSLNGKIPNELGNLWRLEELYIQHNNFTGGIPPGLGNLTNLFDISLAANNLTGLIPTNIGGLSQLITMDFSQNTLNGLIPAQMSHLSQVGFIDLSQNNLTGPIPSTFTNLQNMAVFNADINHLGGAVPDFSNDTNFFVLDIHDDDYDVLTPGTPNLTAINNMVNSNMTVTYTPQNSPSFMSEPFDQTNAPGTTATIEAAAVGAPPILFQWQRNGVNLTDNGHITGSLSNVLVIANVQLGDSGSYQLLPMTNGWGRSAASSVATLTIGGMGALVSPVEYNALTALYNSTAGGNWLTNSGWLNPNVLWYGVTVSGATFDANGNVTAPGHVTAIDLENNNLTGSIPSGITNLTQLIELDLSTNQISGPIPDLSVLSASLAVDLADNDFNVLAGPDLAEIDAMLGAGQSIDYSPQNGPYIITQPVNRAAGFGSTAAFSVQANGAPPLSYQWESNGVPLSDSTWITGSHAGVLSIANIQTNDAATYTVIVTNAWNTTESGPAILTVIPEASSGVVFAWGNDNAGQTNVPPGLTNATEVAAGESFSLALLNNTTVAAWGDNTFGQTDVPPNLTNVISISAGEYHALAVTSNGTVVAWGAGTVNNPSDHFDFGQAIPPSGLSSVVAVAGGGYHSIALTAASNGNDAA